jgi:hypothetical protein
MSAFKSEPASSSPYAPYNLLKYFSFTDIEEEKINRDEQDLQDLKRDYLTILFIL